MTPDLSTFQAFIENIFAGNDTVSIPPTPTSVAPPEQAIVIGSAPRNPLDFIVLALVFLATRTNAAEPEFSLCPSCVCGGGGDPRRPTYPPLSFTVVGAASGLKLTVVHLFDENATAHALWNIPGTALKVTTLHLNPTQYVRPGGDGLTARGLADLLTAARALLFAPLLALQGLSPPPGLATLPDALSLTALAYLPARDVCRAGATCRALRQVLSYVAALYGLCTAESHVTTICAPGAPQRGALGTAALTHAGAPAPHT